MLVDAQPPVIAQRAVRIERLFDMALIAQTIAHPRVYPHVIDDLSPPATELHRTLPQSDAVWYLGAFSGDQYLGLFLVQQLNGVLFEVHTALLPVGWGPSAVEAGRAVVAWVFQHTTCRRLITYVPATNLLALRLARGVGMRGFGISPQSIQRGGELVDQHMLGITKESTCQS